MSTYIAVIDDEPDIVELISLHLTKSGYVSAGFHDAAAFYASLSKHVPDLIILDLMLPDIDGYEVCKYLRKSEQFASIPIIMLTAKNEEIDTILGLELGADDYMTKPFSPKELLARIKAVLRRGSQQAVRDEKILTIDDTLSINREKYEVAVNGELLTLTATEFRILELLALRRGRVYTRDEILDHLWGEEKAVIDRTVDVHIRHLRQKLGPATSLLANVRGVGYKMISSTSS